MTVIVHYGTEGNDDISWRYTYGPDNGPDFPHEFYGLGGNDTLSGGYNYDRLYGGDGDDIIRGDAIGNIVPPAGFSQADTLAGGEGNDRLFGQLDNDLLLGGSGADYLDGGVGNDVLYADYEIGVYADGVDTLVGGDGNDVYIVNDLNFAMSASDPGHDRLEIGVSISLGSFQIEDVTLTGSAVEANGNGYGNTIRGNTVGNVLRGLGGADTLYGFAGDDQLDGGNGLDRLYGSVGNDSYWVNAYYDTVFEFDGEGFDRVFTTTSYSLVNAGSIEELILGEGARDGTGNHVANRIVGNAAANTLNGGTGADTLEGGAGNDLYVLNDVYAVYFQGQPSGDYYDSVIEAAGGGTDTIWVSRQPGITLSWLDNTYYELDPNIENGTVIGAGDFDLTGNELANRLYGNADVNVLEGADGNDYLDAYIGEDTLVGGAGNDTYVLNDVYAKYFQGQSIGDFYDTVTEAAGGGIDTILVSRQPGITFSWLDNTYYELDANIENGTVIGAGDFDLTGNELANRLSGNGYSNWLAGDGGNDVLNGGTEADTLEGGAGNDLYVLNDVYALYFNGEPIGDYFDEVLETAGGGIDTIRVGRQPGVTRPYDNAYYTLAEHVENGVVMGSSAFNLTGNGENNALRGNSAANLLGGRGGDDVLTGGLGADVLRGGSQSDVFDFNSVAESGRTTTTRDSIQDFRHLVDQIDVSTIDAKANSAGNNAFSFIGGAAFSAEGQIRAFQSGADTLVLINTNGNTGAEMSILLAAFTATELTFADFIL